MKLLSIFPPIKVTAASLHTIRSRYLDLIRPMAFVSSHFKKKSCLLLACSLETSPLSGLDSKIICTDSLLSTTNLHKKKHHTAGSVGAAVRNALLWYLYVPGTKRQRVLILRGVRIINLILKRERWVESGVPVNVLIKSSFGFIFSLLITLLWIISRWFSF